MADSEDLPQAFPLTRLELVGAAVVAQELEISRRAAETLIYSEFAGTLDGVSPPTAHLNHLGRPVMSREALDALKEVPFAAVDAEADPVVNVRVREARRVDDSDRTYMGWHPRLSEEEADLATSRWWPVPRHDVLGHTFLVTVAGFVARCGRIQETRTDRGRIAYTVDWQDPQVTGQYLRRRITTPQGGSTVYLRARPR